MKTLTSVIVDNEIHDAVIEHFTKEDKNGHAVKSVMIYLRDLDDERTVTSVRISVSSIKELHKTILEIEKMTSEEIVD
jgi:hypothetical protein